MAILEINNVSIEFPGVKALDDVSFSIEKGQVMALCGENGAGKSTLAKIIAGVYPYGEYQGSVVYKDEELRCASTLDAEKRGIAIVHQELNVIYDMTVAENIFISNMPNKRGVVDYKALYEKAAVFLKEVGLDIDPKMKLSDLTVSIMQMIEIAKAIAQEPEVLIFDEATSSLTSKETLVLYGIIRQLKQKGVTMIYVSHKLNEVFEICDAVTVLKDGAFVKSANVSDVTNDDIIRWMVGRELKDMYPDRPNTQHHEETVLKVKDWCVFDPIHPDKKIIDNVSFDLKKGEILGIYGLVGAGRTELVHSLFEGKAIKSSGELWLNNKKLSIRDTADSIQNKISMVTEDRKKTGLILTMNVCHNISLVSIKNMCKNFLFGLKTINKAKEKQQVEDMVKVLSVKTPGLTYNIAKLSGGNQQKVLLSKWLLTYPQVFILDEPTRGIDVGTKAEIYKILRRLANDGISIIMISSELPEIIGVTDRVLVMKEGRFTGESRSDETGEEQLIRYAMGGVHIG